MKEGKDKKVRLECVFSKNNVKAKWFKNKQELFVGKKYKMTSQGDLHVLEITDPKTEDESKYVCQCLEVKTEGYLEVEPPDPVYKFTKKLAKDSKGFTGKETILECCCNSPKAPVKWYKGEELISSSSKKYLIEEDKNGRKFLKIQDSTFDDSGVYTCKINQEEFTTTNLTITDQVFKFMRVLKSIRVNENDPVTLECELDEWDAIVTWYKDGEEIKPGHEQYELTVEGRKRRLFIKKSKLTDEGKYKCVARGDDTECEVLVEPANRFKKKLENKKCLERETVTFEVEMFDSRAPIKWYKNGQEIKPTERISFKYQDEKQLLIIKDATLEDAGEYSVVGTKDMTTKATLTVAEAERAPVINFDQTDITGDAGKSLVVQIPFTVRGTRTSDVVAKLLRNGQPVNAKEISVTIKNDVAHIEFKKAVRDMTDKYTFVVGNSTGEDKRELNVNIVDLPSPPQGPLEILDVFRDRCKLKWKPCKDTGGKPLLYYVVEKQEANARSWVEVGTSESTELDVTDLVHKKEYRFRVKTVTKKGQSEALNSEKTIVAKDPYDEPSPPNNLEVVDWDKNHVDLKWEKPSSDGGSPIEKYIVEYKDKFSSEWVTGPEVPPEKKSARVPNLKEGTQYQFRVKAVNKAGPSQPSEASKPVLVKARFVKPFIIGDGLKGMIVKKGQVIKYDIDFGGEPPPTVKWELNGRELSGNQKISIESTDKNTMIAVKSTVRADSGKYRLTLTNSSGSVTSEADVVVLDKPSAPEGPLILEEVRAERVKLKWRTPRDNGGTDLKGFTIEKMDEENGRWVPCGEVGPEVTNFQVDGLKKGHKYKFRVKAINKEGESAPLETDAAIIAKNPYDEPGAPGKPELVDWDNTSVNLKWQPPESDGGKPIEKYIIEVKDKLSVDWAPILTTPDNKTEAKVEGLKEGATLQFRVRAVNMAGPGTPSEETGPHLVKHRRLKPMIDRTNLKAITVKAGRSVKIEVDIRGEPPPQVKWFFGDVKKDVTTGDEKVEITNIDYHSTFSLNKATRKQSGLYTIRATNASGTDEATVDITVLGKPAKPKGPLEVTDVHAEGCTLKWKPPEDDGGCPIESYEIEKLDEETGRWVRCGKAQGNQNKFEVNNLTPGKKYKFRVKAVNKEGESEELETTTGIVAKNPYEEPGKPGTPEVADYDFDRVDLKWTKPVKDGGAPITGYVIEKRKKGTVMWMKGTEVQGDVTQATCPGLDEGAEYEFRVRAVNKAGPGEPSEASNSVLVKHKNLKPSIDRTNLNPIVVKVGQPIKLEVDVKGEPPPKITWTFGKDKKTVEPDGNLKITDVDYHTSLQVDSAKRKQTGTYTITATNANGTDVATVEIKVLGKPAKPTGPLEVSNVHKEGCTLKWKPPEDDGGCPIEGYEVERLDEETGRWVRCGKTGPGQTQMQVKGLTPGKKYKFRVKAQNKEGDSEELVTESSIVAKDPFEKPGKPGVPTVADYDNNRVDLKWTKPANDGGAPITGYIIEKKKKGPGAAGPWTKATETYTDEPECRIMGLDEGAEYEFRVRAVNKAGPGDPSEASLPQVIKHKNLRPMIDRTNLREVIVKVGTPINLEVDVRGEPPPEITWTFVKDGKEVVSDKDNVTLVNTPYHTSFSMKKPTRKQAGYYLITAKNVNGTDEAKVELKILGKPAKPKGPLEVSNVNKNGCTLKWQPPEDDGGCPLEGYEIEQLDEETGVWVRCGKAGPNQTKFDVTGLTPGKKYKFRVKAVNKEGDSEELETDQKILAKDPFEKPTKPGIPDVVDYDVDHVDLKWTSPVNDGGAPITGYLVEKRKKGSNTWSKATETTGPSTKATVSGLKEGEEYEFRVSAINKCGTSDPSEASLPHLSKYKNLAPQIDRTNLGAIVVKIGRSINIEVDIRGEPPPKVTWSFGDHKKPIDSDGNLLITNVDYHTSFNIEKAARLHSGPFTITATNANGTDEAIVDITVLAKPTKPGGPLEVNNVHAEGCSLKWRPPEDDGGCPIECYEIEKMDEDTGIWVPCGKSTDTRFDVNNLVPGKKYKFRVRAVNKEGDSEELVADQSILAKNEFDEPGKPGRPVATDWDKDHVDLKWTAPASDGGAPITGYIIEKRKKGTHKWTKGKEIKGTATEGTCGDLDEGEEYEFRVIAVNKQGAGEPSDVSASVIAKPRKLAPEIDKSALQNVTIRAGQPVKFDVNVKGEPAPTIQWSFKGEPLKPSETVTIQTDVPNTTMFMLTKTKRAQSGVYTITATNVHGKDEATVEITVVSKPESPKGPLEVSNVHAEGCTLKWDKPEDDGGEPIKYYAVEKLDVETGTWVPVTQTRDTEVDVTGLVPGKKYKFRVKAVNNEGESDPLEAAKEVLAKNPFDEPDKPKNVQASNWDKRHVDLKWDKPESDGGAPITGYIIEKKDISVGKWIKAAEVGPEETNARVYELAEGSQYQFRVKAVNKAGPGKPSDPTESPFSPPGPPGEPRAIDSSPDSITLSWTKPQKDGGSPVTGYVLEKKLAGDPNWTKVPGNITDHTFKVTGLKENQEYEFRVAAVNSAGQGQFSSASDGIKAQYPPSAPRIDPNFRLKDIVVMAGEKFSLEVPFTGTPKPKAEWHVNGELVVPNDRISSEVNADFTILKNKKAKRGDSGIYSLKLSNPEGYDTCTCRVLVIDKPGPPQGPIEVSDVTPETCSLSWRPPLDDGGSPITNYIVERREATSDSWVKCSSFVRTCHYDVIGLEPNKKYFFRVMAENQYGVGAPLDTENAITAKFPFNVPDPPGQPKATDFDANTVTLTWDRPNHDGGSRIQGYIVEYCDVSDGHWVVANPALTKECTLTVSGLVEHREYKFRVKAKNAAGFSRPSPNSSQIKIRPKFAPPSPPRNLRILKVGKTYADIKWDKPQSDGGSKITGYIVERRQVGSGFWIKVNEYGCLDGEYTVMNLVEQTEYDFRVCAVNDAGRSEYTQTAAPVKITEIEGGRKPEFVRKLYARTCNVHKSITLECESTGKPYPTARWLKNGRELVPAQCPPRYRFSEKDGVFKLTIDDVQESDDGDFTCEAINPLGSDRCTGSLKVAAPPAILRCPEEVFLPEADNGKIKIYFTGSSPFDVTLFKDGNQVADSTHLKCTIFDDYAIVFIREVTKSDQGKYRLVVKNESGSAEASFTVYVTGLPGPPTGPLEVTDITRHTAVVAWKPPKFDGGCKVTHYIVERKETTHSQWVTATSTCRECSFMVQGLAENGEYVFRVMAVNENGHGLPLDGPNPIIAKLPFDPPGPPGKPKVTEIGGSFVNLSWDKPENDGGSRITGYWIDKREVGSAAWQQVNSNFPCSTTMINISNLVEDRQYEFRVFAINEAGVGPPSEASGSIKVKDPEAASAPEFVVPLKNIMAKEGKTATFTCTVTAVPKPKISWFKGNREIVDCGKYSILHDGDTYTLGISDVYGEDGDEYSVRASNKAGLRTSRAELIIKSAPKINVPSRFRDHAPGEKGQNVVIKIPFTGYPKPRIRWSKEGEEVETGGHFVVEVKERHAVLTIRDASRLDSGPYTIHAENELGSDSATIKVQISDRPDPPRFPAVETIGDDFINLSWKAPQWDGGSAITSYIIEKREPGTSSWLRCGATRFCLHQVTGLVSQRSYEFRVFAENIFGRSEPSDLTPVIQTKAPQKERVKRRMLQVDAQGKKVRGKSEGKVSNYDQFVTDLPGIPHPVDIKTSSIYDFYDILEEIGTGNFGVVHRCREKKSGKIFAAKFIPVSHPFEKSVIRKEIDIMNQLHHPRLIRLHDAFEDDDEMIMVYEFMSGGELFERITESGYTMTETEVIKYMRQICEAVRHMHDKNILHLDLKPENIMCQTKSGAGSHTIKIIDFGLACKVDPNEVVKISTGTADFAAPEIVEREPVGFYTDMWAVGVLAYVLLSGLSPFAGANDVQTLKNIKNCYWDFEEDSFRTISDDAKDFIRKLLVRNKDKRMTAHECLAHSWLREDRESTSTISTRKLIPLRDKIRAQYNSWFDCLLPIGHIANYSSLRKLHEERYKIHDFWIDRREAAPRFVIRPASTFAYEGTAANFTCRVLAAAPATVSWYRDSSELKQSVKYMKRYNFDDYTFTINRTKLDDRGEYIIRAQNAYGRREEPVFLNVQSKPIEIEHVTLDEPVRRKKEPAPPVWQEEPDCAPTFTFLLRPRVIQLRNSVKLLACVRAKPAAEIKWYRNGKELSKSQVAQSASDGVVTLEIASCGMEDAGKYTCRATNSLGEDETSCQVIMEGE